MQNAQAFDRQRDTTAGIVGTVAGAIANAFYPGTGGVTSALAESTVRSQYNTFGDRPFFESTEKPWQNWPSLVIGTVAGGAGSLLGGAAGGAASSVPTTAGYTGSAAGAGFSGAADVAAGTGGLTSNLSAVLAGLGSRLGTAGGNYAGGLVRRQLYGGGTSVYRRNPYAPIYQGR